MEICRIRRYRQVQHPCREDRRAFALKENPIYPPPPHPPPTGAHEDYGKSSRRPRDDTVAVQLKLLKAKRFE